MNWLFASGGQSIEVSTSVLPMNIQGWFPLGLTGLISLKSKRLSRVFSSTTIKSMSSSALNLLYGPTLTSIQDHWKNRISDYRNFVCKVISLLFNMLSKLVIAFLPRSKHLLISWQQSLSEVILEPKKINSVTSSHFPSICHEVMELYAIVLFCFIFKCWVLSQLFQSCRRCKRCEFGPWVREVPWRSK